MSTDTKHSKCILEPKWRRKKRKQPFTARATAKQRLQLSMIPQIKRKHPQKQSRCVFWAKMAQETGCTYNETTNQPNRRFQHRDKETHRGTDTNRDKERETETKRQRDKETKRQRETERERETGTKRQRDKERETETKRERETETKIQRHRERDRDKERERLEAKRSCVNAERRHS